MGKTRKIVYKATVSFTANKTVLMVSFKTFIPLECNHIALEVKHEQNDT